MKVPLDGRATDYEADASTILGRLLILRELLEGQTDQQQRCFGTCLWHAAVSNARLLAAGLIPTDVPFRAGGNGEEFFGRIWAFGSASVEDKRDHLDSLIRAEKEKSNAA